MKGWAIWIFGGHFQPGLLYDWKRILKTARTQGYNKRQKFCRTRERTEKRQVPEDGKASARLWAVKRLMNTMEKQTKAEKQPRACARGRKN